VSRPEVDLAAARETVPDAAPLVECLTNVVTVTDVANVIRHWGGLPVMSDDRREVAEMVAGADGCLLNMGTVSERGEAAMVAAGEAANEAGVPVVVDPVGVGATSTRDAVAERLVTEVDVAVVKGNRAEVAALAGADAEVRGVESVGDYPDVAADAIACARRTGAVVVASGETDVVATAHAAYEVRAGDPAMARVVGTGCMLGATLATFVAAGAGGTAGGGDDAVLAATLAGTTLFGLAGEAAAAGEFGAVHGPESYRVAFHDAVAGREDVPDAATRIDRVAVEE
jgi:hydroxyethylthiazole kinase